METIYLQLYSLGQYGEQHPMKDNLKKVAQMGYDGDCTRADIFDGQSDSQAGHCADKTI